MIPLHREIDNHPIPHNPKMICRQCLRKSSLRPSSYFVRSFATAVSPGSLANTSPRPDGHSAATSTSTTQPFSTPLSSETTSARPKTKRASIPVSSCPAGTPLKGLNFFKGKDDPVALAEEEYPEWLWKCLEGGKKSGVDAGGSAGGDEFCMCLPVFYYLGKDSILLRDE